MSLVVSLIVPDGVVLAADSLATTMSKINVVGQVQGECTKCGEKLDPQTLEVPPIPIPASSSLFAQKIFNFKGRYGVGFWGMPAVNSQTMNSQIRRLEAILPDNMASVDEVAETMADHLFKEFKKDAGDLRGLPHDTVAFGFHVVGYASRSDTVGKLWSFRIGRDVKRESHNEFGCTVNGENQVVAKLWKKDEALPVPRPNYANFTLQDALDYAEFLIRTTREYQRFANMIPTVGGEADVALITHYAGFKWINCKPLTRMLEGA